MKKLITSVFILSAAFAFAESVTGVTAKQRWPWNNLVDIDFTLSNPAKQGEVYHIEIEAQSQSASGVKYSAKTLVTEPIVGAGTHRMTWDFGTDYPNVKIADMVFTVSATPFDGSQPVYMVVDLSGGQTATSYPVRYTTTAPVHTVGQNDPCKTTELWLKRVRAGTFTAGNGTGTSSNYYYPEHTCVLTNDFYLGVFSLTKAQYLNVADLGKYDYFTNQACYATRPCDDIVSPRGPETKASENPASDSWLGKLNTRTGLVFDLPTEWQWEYVARAGGGTYDTAQIRNSTNVSASDPDQN